MTKMAAMPIYGKNLKRSSSLEPNADDLETWCAALGVQILPSFFKWWSWVDLDLFYGKVKFAPYAFVWEKGKTMDFSETTLVYDVNVGRGRKLNEYMNLYEYQRSRSFIDLGPRSLRFTISNFFSL